ncbi:MAG TPA: RDD family protein [Solirubrobacteraceae bacterium]|nr:RDD family protein [Solirubrobacteraceae bacterium]
MGDVLGRRIVAAVIDVALIGILLIVIAKVLGNDENREYSLWAETQGGPRALFFLLTFLYFFATELISGQTLGKRVMKLRVVLENGSKAGAGPVAIRNLLRAIDWLPSLYIVGIITIFATGERRIRLGDMAAKTRVVADAGAPAPPTPPERPDDDEVLAQIMR